LSSITTNLVDISSKLVVEPKLPALHP